LPSPRVIFEHQYREAAAEGAIYELRMRLLADKVPELRSAAYGKRLKGVEERILTHFANALSEDEKNALRLSLELRNKILHCDFSAARDRLERLGERTQRGNVKKADIRGLSGAQMAEKIASVIGESPGTFEYVADSEAGAGRVFGWLLEAGQSGDFTRAVCAFTRAAAIVGRLAML